MKRGILTVVLLGALASLGMAQEGLEVDSVIYSKDKYSVETNGFWKNWFVSAGVGTRVYMGDYDSYRKFAGRLSMAVDAAVGKWFTPGIAVRLAYNGLNMKGATNNGLNTNGKRVHGTMVDGAWLEEEKAYMSNLHADVMFNLTNLIGGYKEDRVWNSSMYIGFGWARFGGVAPDNDFSSTLGWMNSFALNRHWDLNVDVNACMMRDRLDGVTQGFGRDGCVGLTVGAAYKMGHGWNRAKTLVCVDRTEIDQMQVKLNEAREEYAALEDENANLKTEVEREKNRKVEEKLVSGLYVKFDIGKALLSMEARVNIGLYAEAIKASDPKAVYVITGYADKATGRPGVNMYLSKRRARAIFNTLVEVHGINPEQLRMEYKGGVDNMFYNNPDLNRASIMKRLDK